MTHESPGPGPHRAKQDSWDYRKPTAGPTAPQSSSQGTLGCAEDTQTTLSSQLLSPRQPDSQLSYPIPFPGCHTSNLQNTSFQLFPRRCLQPGSPLREVWVVFYSLGPGHTLWLHWFLCFLRHCAEGGSGGVRLQKSLLGISIRIKWGSVGGQPPNSQVM